MAAPNPHQSKAVSPLVVLGPLMLVTGIVVAFSLLPAPMMPPHMESVVQPLALPIALIGGVLTAVSVGSVVYQERT